MIFTGKDLPGKGSSREIAPPCRLGVPAGVEREVVAAGELAPAVRALERLRAGVLAVVAGQLVGAGEAPLAAVPRARVRLLAWKGRRKS